MVGFNDTKAMMTLIKPGDLVIWRNRPGIFSGPNIYAKLDDVAADVYHSRPTEDYKLPMLVIAVSRCNFTNFAFVSPVFGWIRERWILQVDEHDETR